MKIEDFDNNCSMVALKHVLPDRTDKQIIEACLKAGYTEWFGMLPQQIENALTELGIHFEIGNHLRMAHSTMMGDFRNGMTLNQVLSATRDQVCLIRVVGHVLASNRGIPLDTNTRRRGPRRRVLGFYVLRNATIEAREISAISSNPEIQFVHDIRHDARSRKQMYEQIYDFLGDPAMPVRFDDLKQFGYTRRMMRKHIERGDAIVVNA